MNHITEPKREIIATAKSEWPKMLLQVILE